MRMTLVSLATFLDQPLPNITYILMQPMPVGSVAEAVSSNPTTPTGLVQDLLPSLRPLSDYAVLILTYSAHPVSACRPERRHMFGGIVFVFR